MEAVNQTWSGAGYQLRLSGWIRGVSPDRSGPLALPEDILYERYRFSSQGIRYFIFLVGPYVDSAYCCAVHVSPWESGGVQAARQAWVSACRGSSPKWCAFMCSLHGHTSYVIWNTYSLKVMGFYCCAYFELEPMFSTPCWHHIYEGKRNDDRPRHHRCMSAVVNICCTFLHRVYLKWIP